jgi:hypothetical protein
MRKFAYGLLALIFLLIAVYAVWVQFPRIENPQLVETIYKDTDARFEALQVGADDPEKNGFLNPALLPYWGRMEIEQDPNATSRATIEAWNNYSSPSQGASIDHKLLQSESDQSYLAALENMKKLGSEFYAATDKPLFFPPNFTLDFNATVPNYIALRSSAHAMVGLAAAHTVEGDHKKATECLVAPLRLGRRLQGQGVLISDMIGIAIQNIATDGMFGLLDINSDLPAEQWKMVAQSLLDEAPPKDLLQHSLEGEMTAVRNTLKLYKQGHKQEEILQVDLLPGYLDREARIYVNVMTDSIAQLKETGSATLPPVHTNPSTSDWISGKTGTLVQLIVPNYSRAADNIQRTRDLVLAAATAYGVAAYRAQEGELPKEISELKKAGIPLTDDAEFLAGVEWDVDSGILKMKTKSLPGEVPPVVGEYWENTWVKADKEFLTFIFGPTKSASTP